MPGILLALACCAAWGCSDKGSIIWAARQACPSILCWQLLLTCIASLHLQAGGGWAAPAYCCFHAVHGLLTAQCVLLELQDLGVAPGRVVVDIHQ